VKIKNKQKIKNKIDLLIVLLLFINYSLSPQIIEAVSFLSCKS